MTDFSDADLIAFLDEALSDERSTALERQLRDDELLRERLVIVRGRETAGLHTLGAIWRRGRLSCPTREELGQYLLETLPDDHSDYIRFHLQTSECRYCQANLADLEAASQVDSNSVRRRRYFQTSAGYLKKS
ncbi:MAG: hypothetical protein KDA80_22410 [Planctomycetaceae bacterium]|nr:hypothetical protein [Planctomycetaceae bacterium]